MAKAKSLVATPTQNSSATNTVQDRIVTMESTSATPTFTQGLADYIASSYPIIYVQTHEEARVDEDINQAVYKGRTLNGSRPIPKEGLKVVHWNCVEGLKTINYNAANKTWDKNAQPVQQTSDLVLALKHVDTQLTTSQFTTYVFHDVRFKFLNLMAAEAIIRWLRNLAKKIPNSSVSFIFVGPEFNPPLELEHEIQSIEYSLPDEEHIRNKFADTVSSTKTSIESDNKNTSGNRKVIEPTNDTIIQLVEAAKGLTSNELSNVFALATRQAVVQIKDGDTVKNGDVDFNIAAFSKTVFNEKIKQVKKTGALEYLDPGVTFDHIGGLRGVKRWVVRRKKGYSAAAKAAGLPPPRGMLLAGIPGNGKSMIAKAIATEFNAPLFQLDVGKLFSHLVGASEANLRYTLKVIEAIGRSVILIDEIDKTLNTNSTNGQGDSGVSARMFGTLLSWMNDRVVPAFIVMTCNNHKIIPPELLRKGRMDAVFWTDVPNRKATEEIFNVCFKQRGFDPTKFSVKHLAEKAEGFVGAEIQSVIGDAMYEAFDKDVPLNDDILLAEIAKLVPQSKTMAEKIEDLRKSAKDVLLDADDDSEELTFAQSMKAFDFNA